MDPLLTADEKLSQVERLTVQTAGELERVSPRLAERLAKLRADARALRLDFVREARRMERRVGQVAA